MRGLVRSFLSAGLMIAVALTAGSAEAAKEKKKDEAGKAVFAIPKEITLTADQQTKVDELKKEQGPKVA